MDDLISKRALLRHLDMAIECKDCPRNTDGITYQERCACSEVSDICNIITDFATFADVQPVKHGTWSNQKLFDDGFGGGKVGYICSACSKYVPYKGNYCSECGAKMDLE